MSKYDIKQVEYKGEQLWQIVENKSPLDVSEYYYNLLLRQNVKNELEPYFREIGEYDEDCFVVRKYKPGMKDDNKWSYYFSGSKGYLKEKGGAFNEELGRRVKSYGTIISKRENDEKRYTLWACLKIGNDYKYKYDYNQYNSFVPLEENRYFFYAIQKGKNGKDVKKRIYRTGEIVREDKSKCRYWSNGRDFIPNGNVRWPFEYSEDFYDECIYDKDHEIFRVRINDMWTLLKYYHSFFYCNKYNTCRRNTIGHTCAQNYNYKEGHFCYLRGLKWYKSNMEITFDDKYLIIENDTEHDFYVIENKYSVSRISRDWDDVEIDNENKCVSYYQDGKHYKQSFDELVTQFNHKKEERENNKKKVDGNESEKTAVVSNNVQVEQIPINKNQQENFQIETFDFSSLECHNEWNVDYFRLLKRPIIIQKKGYVIIESGCTDRKTNSFIANETNILFADDKCLYLCYFIRKKTYRLRYRFIMNETNQNEITNSIKPNRWIEVNKTFSHDTFVEDVINQLKPDQGSGSIVAEDNSIDYVKTLQPEMEIIKSINNALNASDIDIEKRKKVFRILFDKKKLLKCNWESQGFSPKANTLLSDDTDSKSFCNIITDRCSLTVKERNELTTILDYFIHIRHLEFRRAIEYLCLEHSKGEQIKNFIEDDSNAIFDELIEFIIGEKLSSFSTSTESIITKPIPQNNDEFKIQGKSNEKPLQLKLDEIFVRKSIGGRQDGTIATPQGTQSLFIFVDADAINKIKEDNNKLYNVRGEGKGREDQCESMGNNKTVTENVHGRTIYILALDKKDRGKCSLFDIVKYVGYTSVQEPINRNGDESRKVLYFKVESLVRFAKNNE